MKGKILSKLAEYYFGTSENMRFVYKIDIMFLQPVIIVIKRRDFVDKKKLSFLWASISASPS